MTGDNCNLYLYVNLLLTKFVYMFNIMCFTIQLSDHGKSSHIINTIDSLIGTKSTLTQKVLRTTRKKFREILSIPSLLFNFVVSLIIIEVNQGR